LGEASGGGVVVAGAEFEVAAGVLVAAGVAPGLVAAMVPLLVVFPQGS